MTTEELAGRRSTMQNASQEEHAAFLQWRNSIREMTEEERQKYLDPPANVPCDDSGSGRAEGSRAEWEGWAAYVHKGDNMLIVAETFSIC